MDKSLKLSLFWTAVMAVVMFVYVAINHYEYWPVFELVGIVLLADLIRAFLRSRRKQHVR